MKIDGRYVCADSLRFASMLAIIAVHASVVLTMGTTRVAGIEALRLVALTVIKFGVIGFFLIAGFLLEKNLRQQSSFDLLRRKTQKVFLPWMVWFVLTCTATSAADFLHHRRAFSPGVPLHVAIGQTAANNFLTSAFWFVPNLMLALMVLLLFRRYLQSLVFGGVLLATSLFYAVNSYANWFEAHHTRAMFGFVFYLWLGHYAAANAAKFAKLLRSIPMKVLLLTTIVAALAAMGEGLLLEQYHAVEPLNPLKVTSQIYSVLVFLCFFKYQGRIWPSILQVPRTTFGMYLSHLLVLAGSTTALSSLLTQPGPHPVLDSFMMRLGMWLATAILTAGGSLLLARALSASPRFGWVVGASPNAAAAPARSTETATAVMMSP